MNNGAFIVGRDIFEGGLWNDIQKFRIFLFIVGHAVFKNEGIKKGSVHIKRGQYLRSYRNLQRDLEYVENRSEKIYALSSIRRKVNELVDEGYLQTEDTELGTLFTVLEYDRYQDFNSYKKEHGTAREQPENGLRTAREQPENNNNQENQANQGNQDDLKDNVEQKPDLIPYREIIEHLNQNTGKAFKHTAAGHKKLIKARWNEGYRLEDFQKVIEVKSVEWLNDSKMETYLQPTTLFGNKFDQYLNQQSKGGKQIPEKSDEEKMLEELSRQRLANIPIPDDSEFPF